MEKDIEKFKSIRSYLSHDHCSLIARSLTLLDMIKDTHSTIEQYKTESQKCKTYDLDSKTMTNLQGLLTEAIENIVTRLRDNPIETKIVWVSQSLLKYFQFDKDKDSYILLPFDNFSNICHKLNSYSPDLLLLDEESVTHEDPIFGQKIGLFPIVVVAKTENTSLLPNKKTELKRFLNQYIELELIQKISHTQINNQYINQQLFA